MIVLTGLQRLFQKQLPMMPKKYIARVIYDRTHLSMAIIKRTRPSMAITKPCSEVLGGVTWREFRDRKFAELVFCAIDSDQQVKGYGSHLMAHLKDYIRASGPVMHILTYGDTLAMGYFQKQGFTKDITLDKSVWMGYIKDYEGATLMQCSMVPRIRYLEAGRMLSKQKEVVQDKIRHLCNNHVVHQPPEQWANGVITPIDPLSIPAIKATGWSPDELAQEPCHGPHFNNLRRILSLIQTHKQAWPFLSPVNPAEVPGYDKVIKEPMDLSTMEEKLERDQYTTPVEFVNDLKLIWDNCKRFNGVNTVYYKAAVKLEKYMWALINEIPEWLELLN